MGEDTAANKTFVLPYRSKLTEKIEPGQTLIIKGTPKENGKRFAINLHRDSPDFSGNDVPLHIEIKFDNNKVMFNSFSKNEWGKEESQKNPLKKKTSFDIRIRAHENKFIVYLNRKEVKEFEHRVPLQWITHLSIEGDADIQHVQWGGKYYPVPYESGIGGDGFIVGKSLIIYGILLKKAKRFNVNLLMKNGDIALSLNPRFNNNRGSKLVCNCGGSGSVIRNSYIDGKWGIEDFEGKNPFCKGTVFDLIIKNENDGFQINVNGKHFTLFPHRVMDSEIAGIQIQGDVEIAGIQIH